MPNGCLKLYKNCPSDELSKWGDIKNEHNFDFNDFMKSELNLFFVKWRLILISTATTWKFNQF